MLATGLMSGLMLNPHAGYSCKASTAWKAEVNVMQELFPRSYAETAEWLRRERTAYHDTLARCEEELNSALGADPQLMSLAVTCQASLLNSSELLRC